MVTESGDMFTITIMKIHQYFFGPQTYTHGLGQQTSGICSSIFSTINIRVGEI